MPDEIKITLESNQQDFLTYEAHWFDCVDYGYGQSDIERTSPLKPQATKFFKAAHLTFVGANSQLLDRQPNSQAIQNMRMASETFLKTVLIQELDLTKEKLKKIGHNLTKAANECATATNDDTFKEISKRVSLYPSVSSRYEDTTYSNIELWQAAMLTQFIGATVTRRYTNRNRNIKTG